MSAIRRALLVLALGLVLVASLAAPVAAAPDPERNKNAIHLTVQCESGDIVVATIAHNQAVGSQVVGGGTVVILWADVFDNPDFSGDPLFSFGNRGFTNASLETETCVLLDNPNTPGLFTRMELLILD